MSTPVAADTRVPTPSTAPPTGNTTGNTSTTTAPIPTPDIFDPLLIPSLLPRIQRILSLLQAAATPGPGGALVVPPEGSGGADRSVNASTGATAGQAQADTDRGDDATGPSIALGQVSDDDTSLYDFLFSAAGGGGGGGAGPAALGGGTGARPTELSLKLLGEARELRDVYRTAMRACKGIEGGEWGEDEVQRMVRTLEEWRQRERDENAAFYESASTLLDSLESEGQ